MLYVPSSEAIIPETKEESLWLSSITLANDKG
jgi:hypothetical protein